MYLFRNMYTHIYVTKTEGKVAMNLRKRRVTMGEAGKRKGQEAVM